MGLRLLAEATPEASAGAKDLVYSYSSGGFSTVTLNEHFLLFVQQRLQFRFRRIIA